MNRQIGKKFEYLRENELLRKIILACLLGAQMGSINEKKLRFRKSRDTAPLRLQRNVKKIKHQLHVDFKNFVRIALSFKS